MRAVALIRAAHLQPVVAVTAVSVALAVSVGRGLSGALVVGVAVLAGQLSVGWSNDYFDRGRAHSAHRVRSAIASFGLAGGSRTLCRSGRGVGLQRGT